MNKEGWVSFHFRVLDTIENCYIIIRYHVNVFKCFVNVKVNQMFPFLSFYDESRCVQICTVLSLFCCPSNKEGEKKRKDSTFCYFCLRGKSKNKTWFGCQQFVSRFMVDVELHPHRIAPIF